MTPYESGLALHRQGNLAEARLHYHEALRADGSRTADASEFALALRHAPRLFTTPTEPLPLKDVAVVIHPDVPLIGYHLFWEDDIDFPADNDPCDHEVVWVVLDNARSRVEGVYTYYHTAVLTSDAAAADALAHHGRPRFDVQWGKHGSLPLGWQTIGDGKVLEDMEKTYTRLRDTGCRQADHPLAKGWPDRFTGSWEAFVDFSVEVDPRPLLSKKRMAVVSRIANAAIAWNFLRYCFAVKYSWPGLNGDDATF